MSNPLEDGIETNGKKKLGCTCQPSIVLHDKPFTDAVVLNAYPQFRDRSLYTSWGEWGEEFGRFWSRCRGKNLPDIPQTGFIIFLWFPSHCHLIDDQFSVVPPSPFILCWRLLIPIKSPPLDKWRLRRLVSVRTLQSFLMSVSQYICLTRARPNTSFHWSAKENWSCLRWRNIIFQLVLLLDWYRISFRYSSLAGKSLQNAPRYSRVISPNGKCPATQRVFILITSGPP